MNGIFEITTSGDMFEYLKKKYVCFMDKPSIETLLDAIFPFCHLIEWIHKEGVEKNNSKAIELNKHFLSLNEYKVIRSLCNNTKHFLKKDKFNTDSIHGTRSGLLRAGDSLSQIYFVVDGTDIRDIFISIYKLYFDFFNENEK